MFVLADLPSHDQELVHFFSRQVWRPFRPRTIATVARSIFRLVRKRLAADEICMDLLSGSESMDEVNHISELVYAVHAWLQATPDGTWGMKYAHLLDLLDVAVVRAARAGT